MAWWSLPKPCRTSAPSRSAFGCATVPVAKFLKTLTYQRLTSDQATLRIAPAIVHFDRMDRLHGHELTAAMRLERAGGTVPPEAEHR